jgi:hypothetical protein
MRQPARLQRRTEQAADEKLSKVPVGGTVAAAEEIRACSYHHLLQPELQRVGSMVAVAAVSELTEYEIKPPNPQIIMKLHADKEILPLPLMMPASRQLCSQN